MAKRLKHTIGSQSSYRFSIKAVAFDGSVAVQPLPAGTFVYFEIERDGVTIFAADNDAGANLTIFSDPLGLVDVIVPFAAMTLPDPEPGGLVDYGVIVRLTPGGPDTRLEAVRGKLLIVNELVDVA